MNGPDNTAGSGSDVGYGRPPAASRFKPGQSGNPRGRPRRRRTTLPYDAVLGQLVTIREDGRKRRVTAAEAFLLHLTRSGLAGNGPAGRAALAAIETAREARGPAGSDEITQFSWHIIDPRFATLGLIPLRMVVKLKPYSDTPKMLIQPWLVQAALARLGDRRLTLTEQAEVWRATRTPHKVAWPDWWTLTPELLKQIPVAPVAEVDR